MRRLVAPLVAAIALCAMTFGASGALAAAPTISKTTFSHISTTSVFLEADINPQGKATSYHFEYGLGDCEPGPCASTADGGLAKGTSAVRVKAEVQGLNPGKTYHFRALATNIEGGVKSLDDTLMTYLSPQDFGPCSNEQWRAANPAGGRIENSSANLPDCRAYEQATPVDKGAGDATGTAPFDRASLSGGAISFLSVSGIPGGEGSQDFPLYLANRGDSWSTQGLLPPAATGQQAAVIGWTPDFSGVYTKATELGEPPLMTFMATSPGTAPKTIAPYTANLEPNFAGASNNGATVLFESKAAIAGVGGAITGKSNLYLWDKASETLGLAGQMNDKQAPPGGAFAGPYDWINGTSPTTLTKGGASRRYYTQDQHAVSADGSAVYFTAGGTGQLYERRNPTQAQSDLNGEGECTKSELACTVQVSVSHRTIPDPAGVRPAAFMGASADGSKALFTSSQMLTDDANAGPEQKPAAIERADLDGTSVVPSFLPARASGIAVDGEHLYWVDLDKSTIARAKLNGTQAEDEFITATSNPKNVAVDGDHIYWTNAATKVEEEDGTIKVLEGTVGRAKLGASGVEEVEPNFIAAAGNPDAVAVDAEHVYWTNDPPPGITGLGAVGRAKVNGGEANSEFFPIPGIGGEELSGISVDAEHIYWMGTSTGGFSRISRAKLDGSGYEVTFIFLGEQVEGKGLAVEGSQIYWSTRAAEAIGRAKLNDESAASEVFPEFIKEANHPLGVAVDSTRLYWSSNGDAPPNPGNDLYEYDATSNTLIDLVPDSGEEAGADVLGVLGSSENATYVYFAANGVPNEVVGSPNTEGEVAETGNCKGILSQSVSGSCNLYLAHEGSVQFISRLDISGTEDETDAANWAATPKGIFPNSVFQKTARVSPDGRTLLFRSQRQLTGSLSDGAPELYLFRVGDGEVSCVSCNPTGGAPVSTGQARLGAMTTSAVIPTPPASTLSHNLSADGNHVFFETTDALVGSDTNGNGGCPLVGAALQKFPACTDVYEWEAQGTGSCDAAHAVAQGGCIYLISTGRGSEPALIADASPDGKDIFFYTRSRLVGQDEDSLLDIYDAREQGGLASQNQPPPNPCLGTEACHSNGPQPSEIPPPPKFSGPGNPKNKGPPCAKGKHRVKDRCVAKKHHKKSAKGKAKNKGRAGR
jgi:sugar lactone lactonase YvrE